MVTILSQRGLAGSLARNLSASRALGALFALLLSWQERDSQRRHLAGLEPRMLKDMGLSQADIDHECTKPFWRS